MVVGPPTITVTVLAHGFVTGSILRPVEARTTLSDPAEIDAAGSRIAATKGSAYAQYLAHPRQAESVLSDDAFASFRAGGIGPVAGIRQPLVPYAAAHPDVRVPAQRFMEINRVVALPSGELGRRAPSGRPAREAGG